jgi:hypothetical protein
VEAKGLLLSAIRDPNPVVYFEPKLLYRSAVEEVPVGDYQIPLGKARIVRPVRIHLLSSLTFREYSNNLVLIGQGYHHRWLGCPIARPRQGLRDGPEGAWS